MATRKKNKIEVIEKKPEVSYETDEVVLTKEGARQIQADLDHLRVTRKEVLERVKVAMQYGEPMENSELEEAKAEQAAVDGRIQELSRLLHSARMVEGVAADGAVHIGTTVRVKDAASGEDHEYHVVGAMEADPTASRISNLSPMGQALLGKHAGDKISVSTPRGTSNYTILSIE